MNLLSIVYVILAIFVLYIVVSVIYYLVMKWVHRPRDTQSGDVGKEFPPPEYMESVASNCPDYWLADRISGNNVTCKNAYKLDYSDRPGCPQDEATFTRLKSWPPKRNDPALRKRCNWIRKCGPSDTIPASWIGIQDYC